ncbi:Peptidoglycan/LPS O-acetylase OafA/YrhL, contains acyltransferase and SGNH-hydrolase domains [Quadrisphaera granulorum]|uniref:Peptidoglycan/LPS O-acetylase OafA/YrhL n=1 Tax=Quadrisphaera granulorum TaxID=317664 RepID=A0A316AAR4_9ACTN|nr:acyltransferase [Quadrisphaera granulorum]PWJ53944.1 peptidoglycan/LPS O-acetylase OafA/YrhL [Quadrisphaera granulorum]SZE96401.1 Peptidoglycan/LPS O-acetylase OafA/YrhL, contains acyltransferase and SGNH-hydrolase domains [Quadrisphaera granulorum]
MVHHVPARSAATSPAVQSAPTRSGFRPDVEGLRAVALGLVLLFHAGVPGSGGGRLGVDVFFVISGFLITGLLVREVERTGRLDLAGFYARRARRILPAAVVVLLATLTTTAALAPAQLATTGRDGLAAALQLANWRSALADPMDLHPDAAASPLLHYWSLAVEEQFYLLWPPLVLLALAAARRRGRSSDGPGGTSIRRALAVAAGAVAVVSLACSVLLTPVLPTLAYLGTPTRAWQLAAGALLALAVPRLQWWSTGTSQRRHLRRWAPAVSWAALAVVLTSSLWTDDVPYPGWAALVPTLGTVALIAAGIPGLTGASGQGDDGVGARPVGAARLLSARPVRWAGRASYSWYLWHVPVVFAGEALGVSGWPALLALELLVAGPLAALTLVVVEQPFRTSPRFAGARRGLVLGAVATALGVAASVLAIAAS